MIGSYAAVLAVLIASPAIGQAAIALCGGTRWSWLSPAVGLALLGAACWGTVRLPGHGTTAAILVLLLTAAAILFLRGRVEGGGEAIRSGFPVALIAFATASLPFVVEGRFGILGTGFNPDMSQHLLAADRLANGAASQLLDQGYPLGPHAIVVALNKGFGIGLVQSFSGLTIAVAVLAPLTALAAFADQPSLRRTAGALLVGLPYMVASYFAQGAFKETMQALFVLAFALSLREASRNPAWRTLPLRFVPAALIAVGTVYAYSFPGLVWLGGAAAIWIALEVALDRFYVGGVGGPPSGGVHASPGGPGGGGASCTFSAIRSRSAGHDSPKKLSGTPIRSPVTAATGPAGLGASILALIVFAVGALPELGRMIDFQSFETFAPSGPGLGNLFGQISPFEVLGIWPSGDFRVAPGDGAAPAFAFWLGAAFAAVLLLYGVIRCLRRRETAVVAGLVAAAAVYAATRLGGTPYTAAKAIEVAAPLATLVILLAVLDSQPAEAGRRLRKSGRFRETAPAPSVMPPRGAALGPGTSSSRFRGTALARGMSTKRFCGAALGLPSTALYASAAAYVLAAGGSSLLALANAPVGPTSYSPALTELRPLVASDSTLVLAPPRLLEEEHGVPYIAWELRGGRVCIEPEAEPEAVAGGTPPPGIRFVVSEGSPERVSRGSPERVSKNPPERIPEGPSGRISERSPGRPPFRDLRVRHLAGPYVLWERAGPVRGHSPCPLIAVRQARQGPER